MNPILRRLSFLPVAAALAVGGVTAGCVMGQPMTPQEISQHGTHTFAAPKAKVFTATVAALKSDGYQIAFEDEGKGLIKTAPKMVGAVASGNEAMGTYRSYTVKVTEEGGKVNVVATPSVKIGQADVSGDSVWILEGEAGERALWAKLWKTINELL